MGKEFRDDDVIDFAASQNDVTARARELSLLEAYTGAAQAKADLSAQHLAKIVNIYDTASKGQKSRYLQKPKGDKAVRHQTVAIQDFVAGVNAAVSERGIDRAAQPDAFNSAVRSAYRNMIERHDVERIDPSQPDGNAKYNDWFRVYEKSFPIPGERESRADMRDLLATPATDEGYKEFAVGMRDPMTGLYIGGAQGMVVSQAKTGMNVYAFLSPAAQGFGFSRMLHSERKKVMVEVANQFNPNDPRPMLVLFEKNNLSEMPLENIVLDSAGIDVLKMPRAGDNLAKGAISQSQRDATWSMLGAREIANISYIQPSLDAGKGDDSVTRIADPKLRALTIRALQGDKTLSEAQRNEASQAVSAALGGRDAHVPLALCAYVDGGQTSVDAKQLGQFLETFLGESCLATNAQGLKDDIFAQATLGKIQQVTTRDGRLALAPIKPFGGPIKVKSFAAAEMVTQALLKVVPLAEVQKAANAAAAGAPEVTYGEWLQRYGTEIKVELGRDFRAANKADADNKAAPNKVAAAHVTAKTRKQPKPKALTM